MSSRSKSEVLKDFKSIPSVGIETAKDFWNLGFRSKEELIDQNPEELYDKLCELQQCKVDMCMLYVFRCAVYYVSNASHDPELLKWWNWKEEV